MNEFKDLGEADDKPLVFATAVEAPRQGSAPCRSPLYVGFTSYDAQRLLDKEVR